MAEVIIDQRKLRLYKYKVDTGMMTIDQVPEPYQAEIRKTM